MRFCETHCEAHTLGGCKRQKAKAKAKAKARAKAKGKNKKQKTKVRVKVIHIGKDSVSLRMTGLCGILR